LRSYPPTLCEEEEEFVRETMATGDMQDLNAAYQCDAEGRTDFWVAVDEADGDVVGCVGLRVGQMGAGDIGRFTMSHSYRGRGGARMLLETLEAHAAEAGFAAVTATTCSANLAAVGVFKRCGWVEISRGRMDGKPEPEWVPFVKLRKLIRK
jgi:N-acetylglutamate synthase-like GNAT family acetyltransferase